MRLVGWLVGSQAASQPEILSPPSSPPDAPPDPESLPGPPPFLSPTRRVHQDLAKTMVRAQAGAHLLVSPRPCPALRLCPPAPPLLPGLALGTLRGVLTCSLLFARSSLARSPRFLGPEVSKDTASRGEIDVGRCLSIKGAEDQLGKPFSFELTTHDDTMYFVALSGERGARAADRCSHLCSMPQVNKTM